MSIINNSYVVGVNGRNLVLNTLGRLYVKVRDRYYEIDFKKLTESVEEEKTKDFILEENNIDIETYEYPGDDKMIVTLDGKFYVTKNNEIKEIVLPTIKVDKNVSNTEVSSNTSNNVITEITSLYVLEKIQGSNLLFDFITGEINAKTLIVSDQARIPIQLYAVKGIGNKVYKGSETNVYYSSNEDEELTYSSLRIWWIRFLCDCEYLTDNYDFWTDLFLTEDYNLRDFTNQTIIDEANTKLQTLNLEKTISDLKFVYENMPNGTTLPENVVWFEIDILSSYDVFVPGDIVTNERESFKGTVIGVAEKSLYVSVNANSDWSSRKLIKCNTNHRECKIVKDNSIIDYTDKDFLYFTVSSANVLLNSGTMVKTQNNLSLSVTIGNNTKTFDLEADSLNMIFFDEQINCIRLN